MQTFQDKVLDLVKKIPRGKVTTYKELGNQLHTKAYRAIGQALKNNPTPITIPCHRVIKSDGTVGGYCGKLNSKRKIDLLRQEGMIIRQGKIADRSCLK